MSGTVAAASASNRDDEERRALLAEGVNPDNAAHVAALHLVQWELTLVAVHDVN